jgi:AT hook motif
MPPKKRGRPAKKAQDPVVDIVSASEEDLDSPPPPKKRGRPLKKVPDAEVAASSEDDSAPPPAKKARGRPRKAPVTIKVSDEEPPKITKAKKPTKGKKVATKAVGSDDDSPAPVPTKKANGKQIANKDEDEDEEVEEEDDDDQDVKLGMPLQFSLTTSYFLKCQSLTTFECATQYQSLDAQFPRNWQYISLEAQKSTVIFIIPY